MVNFVSIRNERFGTWTLMILLSSDLEPQGATIPQVIIIEVWMVVSPKRLVRCYLWLLGAIDFSFITLQIRKSFFQEHDALLPGYHIVQVFKLSQNTRCCLWAVVIYARWEYYWFESSGIRERFSPMGNPSCEITTTPHTTRKEQGDSDSNQTKWERKANPVKKTWFGGNIRPKLSGSGDRRWGRYLGTRSSAILISPKESWAAQWSDKLILGEKS